MEEIKQEGKQITLDEASRLDVLDNKYFKPMVNVQYRLTFKSWEMVRKLIRDYNDHTKMEEKNVLILLVDSIDGVKCPRIQEYSVISKPARDAFEPYLRSGSITKKVINYKMVELGGKQNKRTYQISEVSDKDADAFL